MGARPVATEFVVEAQGDHVHVLADPVGRTGKQGVRDRERIVRITHEEVVIFDACRPVRREAVLPSNTRGTTPSA